MNASGLRIDQRVENVFPHKSVRFRQSVLRTLPKMSWRGCRHELPPPELRCELPKGGPCEGCGARKSKSTRR